MNSLTLKSFFFRRGLLVLWPLLFLVTLTFSDAQDLKQRHLDSNNSAVLSFLHEHFAELDGSLTGDDEFVRKAAEKLRCQVFIANGEGNVFADSHLGAYQGEPRALLQETIKHHRQHYEKAKAGDYFYYPLPQSTGSEPRVLVALVPKLISWTPIMVLLTKVFGSLVFAILLVKLLGHFQLIVIEEDLAALHTPLKAALQHREDTEECESEIFEFQQIHLKIDNIGKGIRSQFKRMNQELHDWGRFYKSMPLGVLFLDARKNLLNANELAFELFDEKEVKVTGKSFISLFRNADVNRFLTQFIENKEKVTSQEFRSLRGTDFQIIKCLAAKVIINRETHVMLVMEDMTHVRQLEQMRRQFASNVSHELRTPITIIRGYLETLQTCLEDENASMALKFTGKALRNTERLSMIVEDLLMLSRLENLNDEEMQDQLETSDIATPVRAALQEISTEMNERYCQIKTQLLSRQLPINPSLLQLCLRNLLENALRYNDAENPQILLTIKAEAQKLIVSVGDNGHGIPPEFQEQVFERFFRIDKSRDRSTGGSGLGLALVKHIMKIHRGSVELNSSDQGCEFRLVFPLHTVVSVDA